MTEISRSRSYTREVIRYKIEEPYPGGKMQRTRGNIQSNEKHHIQVGVAESLNNIKEE